MRRNPSSTAPIGRGGILPDALYGAAKDNEALRGAGFPQPLTISSSGAGAPM